MRVLHVVRRFAPLVGGTERYVGDLARAQVASGHEVTVATLDRDVTAVAPGRLPRKSNHDGVRVERLPGLGTRRFAVTLRPDRLVHLIREADAVHLHDLRFQVGLVTLASRVAQRRLFLHTHGLVFHTTAFRRLKRLAFRLYYDPLLTVTRTRILASSESDLRTLREVAPRAGQRAALIPNAVDLDPLMHLQSEPEPGRIVAIGRVTPSKGLDRLFRTLGTIRAKSWTLEIHGAVEAETGRELKRLAIELEIADRVRMHGTFEDDDECELLRTAAIAVFPSRAEGFGIALLDAMAAGVPVLASDIPAHRLLLAGEHAALVDWDQTSSIGDRLSALLELEPTERLALGSRLRSLAEPYSVERLVGQIDELYAS